MLHQSNSAQENRNYMRYLNRGLKLENWLKRYWLQDQKKIKPMGLGKQGLGIIKT